MDRRLPRCNTRMPASSGAARSSASASRRVLRTNCSSITGVVCGVRVETVEDPLMQKIRQLDKLVDALAKGKAMDKILRQ